MTTEKIVNNYRYRWSEERLEVFHGGRWETSQYHGAILSVRNGQGLYHSGPDLPHLLDLVKAFTWVGIANPEGPNDHSK